jgi:hypothetical protein
MAFWQDEPFACWFVLQPDPDEDEFRYVPDLTLLELKSEQAELERIKQERKKK